MNRGKEHRVLVSFVGTVHADERLARTSQFPARILSAKPSRLGIPQYSVGQCPSHLVLFAERANQCDKSAPSLEFRKDKFLLERFMVVFNELPHQRR
jgi:hypothetical protein